ncbi:MAG: ABC transporter ATP-binding protein [Acidimicrobiia bacterium]
MIEFYRLLWPILGHGTRLRLVVAAVLMAFVALLEGVGLLLLMPLLQLLTSANFSATSTAIDAASELLGREGSSLAVALAVLVFVVYTVKGFAAIFVLRWAATFAMEEEAHLVEKLLRLYLGAPLMVHFELNSSEFQRTINQSLRTIFSQAFVAAFSAGGDLLGVFLIAVILVVSSPGLALVGFLYFVAVLGVYQTVVNRAVKRAASHIHRDQARIFRDVQQSLTSVKELKAGAVEQHFIDRITASRRDMLRSYRTNALMAVQPRYVLELTMVGAAAVVSVFTYSTQDPASATASIAIFLAGGFRILAPLTKVFNGINVVKAAKPSIEQIARDVQELSEPVERQLVDALEVGLIAPQISVRDLSFSYDMRTRVLRNVNLDVFPGEAVALIGSSGAGKSTMVDVLLGLLDPTAGTVLVGGHDLSTVRRAWQRTVAYVPQAIALLDGPVRENIVFGFDDGDDARAWSALESAQLADVVTALPEGLDTRIGERGVRLSGGQRQRLGIARALYRSPSVLVLDEATSALDNETEAQFTDVLAALRGKLTTVAIAHRLSTVRDVDRVYFFSRGCVVAAGTFDQLTLEVPEFARLVELSAVGVAGGGGP